MVEGPDWLSMDAGSGVLSGTPAVADIGEARVLVKVTRTWPAEVTPDQYRPEYFLKDKPEFQLQDKQSFRITVTER